MKIFKSLPSANGTPFFERYAPLIHTLTKFGVIAQIITGLAEIGIIYSLIYPSVFDLLPSQAHAITLTASLLAASILQIGLKTIFPYSVRVFLFKRFTGLDLPLSIFIMMLTASLLTVSILLSYKGSHDIVDVAIKPPSEKTTTATDSIRAATERQANSTFSTDSATIETKYKGKIEALTADYNSKASQADAKASQSRAASPQWSKELTGKANGIRNELKTKLATLEAEKATEIEAKAAERKAWINRALDRNDSELKQIQNDNKDAKTATEQRKGKYKNYVGYFTLFCYIFFLIAFILDEIYKKGAEIKETPTPHQRHFSPPLMSELLEAVKARIDTKLRTMIYKFADATKASPLPNALTPLYDYEIVTPILKIETEPSEDKVIKLPSKGLKVAAKRKDDASKKDDSEPKKTHQIGFKKYDDTKDDTTEKQDDTTIHNDFRNAANLKDDTKKSFTVQMATKGDFGKCENCGNDFFRNHKKQRFCGEDCRKDAWKNKTGKAFDLELKTKERLKKK
jgi:hypothetical protein